MEKLVEVLTGITLLVLLTLIILFNIFVCFYFGVVLLELFKLV